MKEGREVFEVFLRKGNTRFSNASMSCLVKGWDKRWVLMLKMFVGIFSYSKNIQKKKTFNPCIVLVNIIFYH